MLLPHEAARLPLEGGALAQPWRAGLGQSLGGRGLLKALENGAVGCVGSGRHISLAQRELAQTALQL